MTHYSGVPAGWYPDPADPTGMRWWDGYAWTPHTSVPPPMAYAQPMSGAGPVGAVGAGAPGHGYPAQPSYVAGHAYVAPVATRDRSLEWLVPVGRTPLSIVAGYAGLVALLCFYFSPVALVLGLLALRGLRDSPLGGRGRAWFAVVVGSLGTAGFVVFIVTNVLH